MLKALFMKSLIRFVCVHKDWKIKKIKDSPGENCRRYNYRGKRKKRLSEIIKKILHFILCEIISITQIRAEKTAMLSYIRILHVNYRHRLRTLVESSLEKNSSSVCCGFVENTEQSGDVKC